MSASALNSPFDIVAIGCSAGGIEAMKAILTQLQPPFKPAVVVIQHIAPTVHSNLAEFFSEICELPVKEAEDKEAIVGGHIYFAPAGYHLLVEKTRTFALSLDAPVQFARPSIDVFMESVATVYKNRSAGFVLTGANADGAEGLKCIQEAGGLAVVQNPVGAEFKFMPEAALNATETSFVFSLREIEHLITGLG